MGSNFLKISVIANRKTHNNSNNSEYSNKNTLLIDSEKPKANEVVLLNTAASLPSTKPSPLNKKFKFSFCESSLQKTIIGKIAKYSDRKIQDERPAVSMVSHSTIVCVLSVDFFK
jgi:hypothetical protein